MNFYRIYKARVVKIKQTGEENKPEIIVTPEDISGESAIEKRANPPSFIPTSTIGGGSTSIPDIGQLCLVAETDLDYRVNIISYLHPNGFSPHGVLSGEPNSSGGFIMKIGSLNKSVFSMDRAGRMTLYSDGFSRLEIDGSTSTVSTKAKTHVKEYGGGYVEDSYIREDETSGIDDLTTHQSVYTKNMENPGFTDVRHFDVEQPASPAPVSRYVDKAIVKAGSIMNIHSPEERYNHVYQLETRQSTGNNRLDKDTVSVLRLGYQHQNQRFSSGPDYPEGAIIEWNAKRNTHQDNFLYWHRVGKIKDNLPDSGAKGELYSTRILADKRNNRAYGTPTTNPTAEGEGWSTVIDNSSYRQQYTDSIGLVESGSVWRTYVHSTDSSGQGYRYRNIKGGDALYYEEIEDSVESSLYIRSKKTGEDLYKWTTNDHELEIQSTPEGRTIAYTSGKTESVHELSSKGSRIEYVKKGKTTFEITDEKIVMKTGNMELELSEDRGLVLNGKSLVYSTLVDFLTKHQADLTFALGSPSPMSPTAIASFNAETVKDSNVKLIGFKTGI